MPTEKLNTEKQQENGNPEGTQPEKGDEKPGQVCPEHPEKIVNPGDLNGMVDGGIPGMIGNQTDQGEDHQKKKAYADDFFSHGFLTIDSNLNVLLKRFIS